MTVLGKTEAIGHYRAEADRHRKSAERLRTVLADDPRSHELVAHYARLAELADAKADEIADGPAHDSYEVS